MDPESYWRAVTLLFILVDAYGVFCGVDLVRFAWRSRKIAPVLQGYTEMGFWMTMNAALWLCILAQAFILPPATGDGSSPIRAAWTTSIFFLASTTITFALYRGRSLLMSGQQKAHLEGE